MLCRYLCLKLSLGFLSVLCPRPNTPEAKASIYQDHCKPDYVMVTENSCGDSNSKPCEGWQSVWNDDGTLQDWAFTTAGKLEPYLGECSNE